MQQYKIFFLDHRSCYLNSLGDSLAQMGHKIFYQSSWVPEEIEKGIAFFKPDILLTVGWDLPLTYPFLDTLPALCEKYKLFHVYWATEDMIHYDKWSAPFVKRIKPDLVWTIHSACVKKYEDQGIRADYLNFAFNPRLFRAKTSADEERYNVALVGSAHLTHKTYRYNSIQDLIIPLIRENEKVHIWGGHWDKESSFMKREFGECVPKNWLEGYLPYKETGSIYRAAKIVLGLQNAKDQVSQRTFEILGTGGFMIANRTKALSSMFEDRKEIALSSSPEETMSLIRHYLDKPEERLEIGTAAKKKVLKEYYFHKHLLRVHPKLDRLFVQRRENHDSSNKP
ncbi:CgeB family protein [Anaerobacillus isosaccharinicus]|uniref:CgeB family protein n=2 Tax=Anaerobacillus isosaccharinicus TaxID=1532552 RepID=A0A7S7L4G5_9BACI|nr:glycosyltransferase [Anaerobacillus isosaccharinicus]MBA5587608.1 glycosyltransferase [Anaerobacillus isosaccharinicus]QOY34215.1 glycosyltransferase [Anaerobacillus isosaccharinicus]